MTKVIGHRGAKGMALENTLASFRLAQDLGVDRLEFDVRRTADGQFVVCHDDHLRRVADSNISIKRSTYAELQQVALHNGEQVPLLREVLAAAGSTPVIVEIKIVGYTKEICDIVGEFVGLDMWFASFKRSVVAELCQMRPDVPAYVCEHFNPFTAIGDARRLGATGICLNFWLMNPLTYFLTRRLGLKLYVYSTNRAWQTRFLIALYPHIDICTNYPTRTQTALQDRK